MFKDVYFSQGIHTAREDTKGLYSKKWPVEVSDSDFTESIIVEAISGRRSFIVAIIEIYSKKELNVALALTLHFKMQDENQDWPIMEQVKFYAKTVPEFGKYSDDIEKYLMLI